VKGNTNKPLQAYRVQFSLRSLLLSIPIVAVGLVYGAAFVALIATFAGVVYWIRTGRGAWVLGISFCFAAAILTEFGTSVQVRTDTGDQRVCLFGIPAYYRPIAPEVRQALLTLESDDIPRRWVRCGPQVCTNDPASMMRGFYAKAAAWVAEDPDIAKLIVLDLAAYLQNTNAKSGLPQCTPMIWFNVVGRKDSSGAIVVLEGWQSNPEVQKYLADKDHYAQ